MELTLQTLEDLNKQIHRSYDNFEYHMKHIELVKEYALIINSKMGFPFNEEKLSLSALGHDVLKDNCFSPRQNIDIGGHVISLNLNRYVRTHLDILDQFYLGDYFNTDIQLHALAGGILLNEVYGVTDPEILYPIFFHSCPIMDVYKKLSKETRGMVDVLLLADKLSSNYLRINFRRVKVRVDLDAIVFGLDGTEFNYSAGLFIARLIGQERSTEKHSKEATEYYYKRLARINPLLVGRYNSSKLGEFKLMTPRKSKVLNA